MPFQGSKFGFENNAPVPTPLGTVTPLHLPLTVPSSAFPSPAGCWCWCWCLAVLDLPAAAPASWPCASICGKGRATQSADTSAAETHHPSHEACTSSNHCPCPLAFVQPAGEPMPILHGNDLWRAGQLSASSQRHLLHPPITACSQPQHALTACTHPPPSPTSLTLCRPTALPHPTPSS